ncbi:hypothetical protein KZT46_004004 [Escherichia coli]|nr:hypothetical protein [Escherichia coli]ELJ7049491.1 hypothetical protein [Escherichia coli]HBB5060148.1 hypothetical protein [Escherichia coli]
MVDSLAKQHRWAATGVSDYPPRDPLVGQSRFFKRFQTFLHTVDHDDDRFAHVFAVEAEWGRGKSRLGHELVAQINDCSRGWFVRDEQGQLHDKQLFNRDTQDKYLALYIRYSQVASDYQNSDNRLDDFMVSHGAELAAALAPELMGYHGQHSAVKQCVMQHSVEYLREALVVWLARGEKINYSAQDSELLTAAGFRPDAASRADSREKYTPAQNQNYVNKRAELTAR